MGRCGRPGRRAEREFGRLRLSPRRALLSDPPPGLGLRRPASADSRDRADDRAPGRRGMGDADTRDTRVGAVGGRSGDDHLAARWQSNRPEPVRLGLRHRDDATDARARPVHLDDRSAPAPAGGLRPARRRAGEQPLVGGRWSDRGHHHLQPVVGGDRGRRSDLRAAPAGSAACVPDTVALPLGRRRGDRGFAEPALPSDERVAAARDGFGTRGEQRGVGAQRLRADAARDAGAAAGGGVGHRRRLAAARRPAQHRRLAGRRLRRAAGFHLRRWCSTALSGAPDVGDVRGRMRTRRRLDRWPSMAKATVAQRHSRECGGVDGAGATCHPGIRGRPHAGGASRTDGCRPDRLDPVCGTDRADLRRSAHTAAADPGLQLRGGRSAGPLRPGVWPAGPVLWSQRPLCPAPAPGHTDAVLIVGDQFDRVAHLFASCVVLTTLDNGLGVDNEEQGVPVALCERPHDPTGLWAELRHLG